MVRDTSHLKTIVDYIKKNTGKGYTKDSLKWALINQGYMKIEVEKAFKIAEEEMNRTPISRPQAIPVQPAPTMQIEPEPEKVSFWKRWFG
jgi:uncharacterized protein Smg (DUF494 family)